jgi:isopenicillin-N epimerase
MRAISLSQGDIVLTTSLRYHSFGDDLADYCAELGVEVRSVRLPLPISSTAEILSAFRAAFDAAAADGSLARIKLSFFDHVSSKPAVLFPAAELCALCRERSVPSLVDGAHCPGLLCWAGECDPPPASGVRLDQILPDYYLANFYKWMMTPRQCACLYTSPAAGARWEHINTATLNVTLPGGAGVGMATEAIYAGVYDESTRDYAPFLALPGALALLRWMGPGRLRAHGEGLAAWGSAHLAEVWETGPQPVAAALSTSMITAELPLGLPLLTAAMRARDSDGDMDGEAAAVLSWAKTQAHRELLATHRIECPVFVHESRLYVRASCALYNDRDDIEALGKAVLAIAAAWQAEAEQTGSLSKL